MTGQLGGFANADAPSRVAIAQVLQGHGAFGSLLFMSNLLCRMIGLMLAALVMLACQGCKDPNAEDKAAIRRLMNEYHAANQERHGKAIVEMMTSETLRHYTELLRLGMDGAEAEIRRLGAFDRHEVFLMRTLATRKDLKGMDGRAYQIWATGQGWYVSEEDELDSWTDGMSDIKVDLDGKGAWCYILEDHKRTRFMLRFVKGAERWQFEETSVYEYYDEWTKELAAEVGISQDDLLLDFIEESTGIEIDRKAIWKPMKK